MYNFTVNITVRDPQWSYLARITAPDPTAAAQFGFSVATDGVRIVVGCPFGNLGTGATAQSGKVYVYMGPNWSSAVPVVVAAPDASISDYFGYSVAVSGYVFARFTMSSHHAVTVPP